ncbi:DUF4178 domain-containing protein [Niastella caeni]|uniref:DUF4178 domain-containing protein n=1 Tax=Niastella caeni TaxID=2569763 RepID=A0A4S8HZ03_9BACT|nr:DUF4178 domain-containing protein [Niastella caeni]THU40910.1 DUF4178 domain-containing protein [Niastella caeni]
MSITGIHTCPDCNLPLTYRCADTNVIVCSHCFAPVKKPADGHLAQRVNLLIAKDEVTPIQIGTQGEWSGKKFEIIGRLRCVFADGFTNNWTMYFDDGGIMMLVENCGQFAVYEKTTLERNIAFSRVAALDYGSETAELIAGKQYTLERKTTCEYMEVEGETWLFDDDGKFTRLEVAAQRGGRLALIENNKGSYITFRIHYVPFPDFAFKNARSLVIGTVTKELSCSTCNEVTRLYSWPLANSYTCTSCGASYTFENGERKFKRRIGLNKSPAIPLHATGVIRGIQYQVVGFMEKEDDESYKWREYTLFNPIQGYAYLSEFNGHWIFLQETGHAPVITNNKTMQFDYDGKVFKLYNQYRYSVVDSRGEFPGNVFDNKKPNCKEWIAPPEIWARELHDSGLCWFQGKHISRSELYAAFGKDISLPFKVGVGAVQPAPGMVGLSLLLRGGAGILLVFLLLFLFSITYNREQVVYENMFVLPGTPEIPPIVTPPFKLDKWRANLEFHISAPINNSWFETAITLVNADNGNEYAVENGVEMYSGYDGGEYWTEGSSSGDVLMNAIPAGNYFLRIDPSKGPGNIETFSLKATYDVPMWRNFFIFVLFALLPLLAVLVLAVIREGRRWQNSPFYHQ